MMAGSSDEPALQTGARGLPLRAASGGLAGLAIGVPWRHIDGKIDDDVAAGFSRTIESCRRAGATIQVVDAPELDYAGTASVVIQLVEASAYHARWVAARPEGYSDAFRDRLELGASIAGQDYLQAQRARRAIATAVERILEEVDLLCWPTTPTTATPVGGGSEMLRDRPWEVGASHYNLMRLCSLVGVPAVSQPSGTTPEGLPLSIQLAGRRWGERALLSAAASLEVILGSIGQPPLPPPTGADGAPAGGGG